VKTTMVSCERLCYSVREAARLLGLSRTGTYLLIQRGALPSIKLGGRVLVPRKALEAMLDGSGSQ